jgi:peptidoglycan/xylan/chitin deacetylase (PgdA/CDA1 family)
MQEPQLALLDLFIGKSAPLSVGMVMDHFGSDATIVNKVKEGGSLIEYDIHGWDHVDYTTLSAHEQEESISQAQAKMLSVMGKDARAFLPPYNNFDSNTLTAMRLSSLDIISSSKDDPYSPYAPVNDTLGIFHMPQSINYGYTNSSGSSSSSVNTTHAWRTIEEMKQAVNADIDARGWAVVTVHPQDFAKYGEDGKMLNVVDNERVGTFEHFIDEMHNDGRTLTTFEGAIRMMMDNNRHSVAVPSQ